MKPITPAEVIEKSKKEIPHFVIEAFNDLIIRNWRQREARIKYDEVIAEIITKAKDGAITRNEIKQNGWLDIEELYNGFGWTVEVNKPGADGLYGPYYLFIPHSF